MKQNECFDGDIITNPPYKYATQFILKALELTQNKVAMFLKLTALEGKERYNNIYRNQPPKNIYVFINRVSCFKAEQVPESSAICYAWFVWEKGYTGCPQIHWVSTKEIETNQTKLF